MTDTSDADDADDATEGDETDVRDLLDRLEAGDLQLYDLEGEADHETAAAARRRYLAAETGADLSAVGDYTFPAAATKGNVENLIGAAQIPMGVAGPVTVHGSAAAGEYYLPLVTTEGALVASVNRGLSTIHHAGGADARVTKRGMTRAPVFGVSGIAAATTVIEWVEDNLAALAAEAEATTRHGELLAATPYVVGDNVFVRFVYDTKDAMGMNMATIATEAACSRIETETPAELIALSGNLCTDKKPAAINAVEGRGTTVTADVEIPTGLVEERLKTTPAAIAQANTRKNLIGSAKAGSLGFNAQAANVVAAAFLATGQDAAQVVEGANAITTVDAREDTLYASVSLASLEVGTVGGGTTLPTQAAGQDVIGHRGGGDPTGSNADALAEVIATGALAGELSLLAALAARNLASTHADLGR